jgi:hypothetical protein
MSRVGIHARVPHHHIFERMQRFGGSKKFYAAITSVFECEATRDSCDQPGMWYRVNRRREVRHLNNHVSLVTKNCQAIIVLVSRRI